jgi:hypothetical protein
MIETNYRKIFIHLINNNIDNILNNKFIKK